MTKERQVQLPFFNLKDLYLWEGSQDVENMPLGFPDLPQLRT